jgi:hypothetical protein
MFQSTISERLSSHWLIGSSLQPNLRMLALLGMAQKNRSPHHVIEIGRGVGSKESGWLPFP